MMNRTKLVGTIVGAGLMALCACSNQATSGSQSASASGKAAGHETELASMTPDEVDARLAKNDGSFYVFDNNNKKVFDEGHVPGAKWLDFAAVKESDLPSDKSATLVFYCANEH